ncbi:hypothetical protein [Shewanella sp. Isolate8]|uniref:hypothetical protein n=1 Tax=Shewanella sp. Isolate8 TaxID=2908529 RepID=UPI001EFE5A30|nr:hypothetical protein [Shewanella sp. Isolate8]MCG9745104.1 hypothetical protein [Shewanella sp. Isolate8]
MYRLETQRHTKDTDAFWQPQFDGEPNHQDEYYPHHLGGHSQSGTINDSLSALAREAIDQSRQRQLSLNREIVALVAEQARLSLN